MNSVLQAVSLAFIVICVCLYRPSALHLQLRVIKMVQVIIFLCIYSGWVMFYTQCYIYGVRNWFFFLTVMNSLKRVILTGYHFINPTGNVSNGFYYDLLMSSFVFMKLQAPWWSTLYFVFLILFYIFIYNYVLIFVYSNCDLKSIIYT